MILDPDDWFCMEVVSALIYSLRAFKIFLYEFLFSLTRLITLELHGFCV